MQYPQNKFENGSIEFVVEVLNGVKFYNRVIRIIKTIEKNKKGNKIKMDSARLQIINVKFEESIFYLNIF